MSTRLMRNILVSAMVTIALPVMMGMQCPADLTTNMPGDNSTSDSSGDQNQDQVPTGTSADYAGIYVTNYGGNSVTVYSLDADGDAAPKRTISGAKTGIKGPLGIARDTLRQIYVANRSGCNVTVFGAGAGGDVAPVTTLTDADMGSPEGLAIGIDDGVFVSNCPTLGGCGGVAGVFHFTKNTSTSDYRIAGTNTGLTVPVGLALDEARNLFVANAFGGPVNLFGPGQSGDQFPVQSFSPGGNTQSIAYNSATVLLGAGGTGVTEYHSNSTGNTAWLGFLKPAGFSYTGGIFFDTDVTPPIVYAVDFSGNAIYVIQTVGVPPFLSVGTVKVIKGPSTGLMSPYGIVVIKV